MQRGLSLLPVHIKWLSIMRKTYFDAANKFEPYSALYSAGATPDQVKEAIVTLLEPYIRDKSKLRELAVSFFATEAVCVGQLSSRKNWKELLDCCFNIRESAIRVNERMAFEVIGFFELAITAAQANYALMVIFEVPKDELALDEFAFELFRTIGSVIESNLQPYIKELYCLLTVASSKVPDIKSVVAADFGQICEKLEKALKNNLLLTPEPWSLRVNQWRNIAQHHSYIVRDDSVVAMYGKAQPPKQIILSRAELLDLARELGCAEEFPRNHNHQPYREIGSVPPSD